MEEEWAKHRKYAAKRKAAGDSGTRTDMMQLAPGSVKEAYLKITNGALKGTCVPDS